jgi:fluoride exporter
MEMREVLLVFIGGGLGSVVRFSIGKWVNSFHSHHFPLATLTINIVACLVLGVFIGLADHKQIISASSRLFWTVGFCGGFSTFSTFSHENLHLLQSGLTGSLILYIGLSLVLCVAATFGGLYVGEQF